MRELARKLSVNLKEGEKYGDINLENSQKTVRFFKFFISKFTDIIRFIIYRLPSIPDKIIQYLSLEQRTEAWKGIIIGEALKAFQIKNYVCEKLLQLGLRNNSTLKEFHELSKKKINMSFSAVDSQTNSITFLNYITRPSMPVWAAIIATSSLPFFFKPFPDQKEWNYYPVSSHEDRLTKAYFRSDRNLSNYYQSADLLMKHPLELISNEKLKSLITQEKEEIYLTLNFSDESYPYLGEVQEIVSQPITTHDLTFKLDGLPYGFFGLFASVPIIS